MAKNYKSKNNNGKKREKSVKAKTQYTEKRGNHAMDQERSNDINWWNQSVVYDEVTRVPFNRISGVPIDAESLQPTHSGVSASNGKTNITVPTGMKISVIPFIGVSTDINSPINRAFTSMYAALYSKTTGAMQFQQGDLAITTMAVDSILSNIAAVRRALGAAPIYTDVNYAYPKALLQLLNIDYSTVIGKQDEIRRRLNDSIRNLNSLIIPKFMSIFDRHYSLFHNIYVDESDLRGQIYAFVPQGYYTYVEAGEQDYDSESLVYHEWETQDAKGMSIDELLDIISQQISDLRHSSSFGLVMGTVRRAFPDTHILTIPEAPSDAILVPTVDRNIMWQIENMLPCGQPAAKSLDVVVDPVGDALLCQPFFDGSKVASAAAGVLTTAPNFMLNSYTGDTDAEFIMEATRLMPVGYENMEMADDIGGSPIQLTASGTEIVTKYSVMGIENTGADATVMYTNSGWLDADWGYTDMVLSLMPFKYKPTQYIFGVGGNFLGLVNEWYRYTTVDCDSIAHLHEAALLSVYNSSIGRFIDTFIK